MSLVYYDIFIIMSIIVLFFFPIYHESILGHVIVSKVLLLTRLVSLSIPKT